MLQPYRSARPHTAAACRQCGPRGQGHHLCQAPGCHQVATTQVQRHATLADYNALPLKLAPADGVATRPVFACDDCAEDLEPFCVHEPVVLPCPVCGAAGEAPCTKKDRTTPRASWHFNRPEPTVEPCTHAHREDCQVFTGCRCAGDDPLPVRAVRPPAAGLTGPNISGLTIPLHHAQMVLARAKIAWLSVVSVRSCLTQDNRPAIAVEVQQYTPEGTLEFDEHGHPVTVEQTIALPQLEASPQ